MNGPNGRREYGHSWRVPQRAEGRDHPLCRARKSRTMKAILIVADMLRRDHLRTYGNARVHRSLLRVPVPIGIGRSDTSPLGPASRAVDKKDIRTDNSAYRLTA